MKLTKSKLQKLILEAFAEVEGEKAEAGAAVEPADVEGAEGFDPESGQWKGEGEFDPLSLLLLWFNHHSHAGTKNAQAHAIIDKEMTQRQALGALKNTYWPDPDFQAYIYDFVGPYAFRALRGVFGGAEGGEEDFEKRYAKLAGIEGLAGAGDER